MTDQQVIEAILAGGALTTKALDFVYDEYGGKVTGYMLRKEIDRSNGQAEELAYDLFIEAIMALRDNVLAGRLTGFKKGGMGTYLTTICRYKYYALVKKAARKRKQGSLVLGTEEVVDEQLPIVLRRIVRELGQKCREMITYFYFDELPMKEVIKLTTHEYKSAAIGNVTNQRCRETLKKELTEYLLIHNPPTTRHDGA